MPLHTYNLHGREIRSNRPLQDWGLALAVVVSDAFGNAPARHFTADLLKQDRLYPPEWYPLIRRDRINRLYATPVSVDRLTFSIESSAKTTIYQKTKRLVAVEGVVEDDGLRGYAGSPARPNVAAFAPAAWPAHVAADAASTASASSASTPFDIEVLKAAVIEDVMSRVEMMFGARPQAAGGAAPQQGLREALQPFSRRILEVERSHERLVDALKINKLDSYEPFRVPEEFPVDRS